MEKDYKGVNVTKSWSFLSFAKEFGQPKLANCTNSQTGEIFKAVAFEDKEGNLTFCHFGYSTQGMSAKEISSQAKDLKVGLNSSGNYTLYKQGEGAWENIEIDLGFD